MEQIERSPVEKKISAPLWAGIALLGTSIGGGAVYLCYYNIAGPRPDSSGPAILSGAGLIISFCLLTLSLIMGIRNLIQSVEYRKWAIVNLVISGTGIIALVGICVLGIMMRG